MATPIKWWDRWTETTKLNNTKRTQSKVAAFFFGGDHEKTISNFSVCPADCLYAAVLRLCQRRRQYGRWRCAYYHRRCGKRRSSKYTASIAAIKRYFCSEYTIRRIADATGFDYDTLIGGKYKILLEPLTDLTYNNNLYCMSATEAALYDRLGNGDSFVANIVDLNERIPPDPPVTDTSPGYSVPALPANPQKTTAN